MLVFSGMVLLSAGIWVIESRSLRTKAEVVLAVLLCLSGIVVIATASDAGLSWELRLTIAATYSTAGALLVEPTVNAYSKSRTGTILSSLGKSGHTGLNVISAVVPLMGILGAVAQFIDPHRHGSTLFPISQALFFISFGVWAWLITRTQWLLADRGIIGPNLFVPWEQVTTYDWQDSNALAITVAGFAFARRFTISVAPEAREYAEAILFNKIRVSSWRMRFRTANRSAAIGIPVRNRQKSYAPPTRAHAASDRVAPVFTTSLQP
jgi:hypothetical protein